MNQKNGQLHKRHQRGRILLLCMGVLLFLTGLVMLLRTVFSYQAAQEVYETAQEKFVRTADDESAKAADASFRRKDSMQAAEGVTDRAQPGQNAADRDAALAEKEVSGRNRIIVDFDGLKALNPDIIGWIWFENEDISYPVLKGESNQTYLRTAYDRTPAVAGSIFVESSNTADFQDRHTILYGHNMHDETMFGRLKFYRRKDYYETHPYFQILTPEAVYRYQIFACEDIAEDGFVYQTVFSGDDAFEDFIQKIWDNALRQSELPVLATDKIVTLSTCGASGRRLCVHAKLVSEEPVNP